MLLYLIKITLGDIITPLIYTQTPSVFRCKHPQSRVYIPIPCCQTPFPTLQRNHQSPIKTNNSLIPGKKNSTHKRNSLTQIHKLTQTPYSPSHPSHTFPPPSRFQAAHSMYLGAHTDRPSPASDAQVYSYHSHHRYRSPLLPCAHPLCAHPLSLPPATSYAPDALSDAHQS